MVRAREGLGDNECDEQAVTESNHQGASWCQPESPWPGSRGDLSLMKEALLLKNGALKVHADVGMDFVVGRAGVTLILLPVIIRNSVLFECPFIMRVHERVRESGSSC